MTGSTHDKYATRVAKAFGHWTRFIDGKGWERCTPTDKGAVPDRETAHSIIAMYRERVRRYLAGENISWENYDPILRPTEFAEIGADCASVYDCPQKLAELREMRGASEVKL